MESIIRNVGEINTDERRVYESLLGHTLRDNQQVIIRVLSPGVEPDQQMRHEAIADLKELSKEGSMHRESLGVSIEEADAITEEAIRHVRSHKND